MIIAMITRIATAVISGVMASIVVCIVCTCSGVAGVGVGAGGAVTAMLVWAHDG